MPHFDDKVFHHGITTHREQTFVVICSEADCPRLGEAIYMDFRYMRSPHALVRAVEMHIERAEGKGRKPMIGDHKDRQSV